MPANTSPIFPVTPVVTWGTVQTANTARDGTGSVVTVHTAGANGSRVDYLKVRSTGTAVVTVLRVFINNGSDATVAANNVLFMEQTIVATTASEAAALVDTSIPLNLTLPAGYKINVVISATVAAAIHVAAVAGAY